MHVLLCRKIVAAQHCPIHGKGNAVVETPQISEYCTIADFKADKHLDCVAEVSVSLLCTLCFDAPKRS